MMGSPRKLRSGQSGWLASSGNGTDPSAAESKHPVSPLQRPKKIAAITAALWSFVRTASREVEIGSTIISNRTDVEGKSRKDSRMRLLLQLQRAAGLNR
jgi:hypothetical protein